MPLDRTTNNVNRSNFRMKDSKTCNSGNCSLLTFAILPNWEMQTVLTPALKSRRQTYTAEYRENGTAVPELP
jgi:hypothetical protein